MKLLLDTHIWVWSVLEPHRVSRRVQRMLQSSDNEIWLSPISTWEVLVLHAKRRIRLDENPGAWVLRAAANTREAPLTQEIVVAAQRLEWAHTDPADRFLAATAQVLGLSLVTADAQMLTLKHIATVSNR